jgi:hypothetical protein
LLSRFNVLCRYNSEIVAGESVDERGDEYEQALLDLFNAVGLDKLNPVYP